MTAASFGFTPQSDPEKPAPRRALELRRRGGTEVEAPTTRNRKAVGSSRRPDTSPAGALSPALKHRRSPLDRPTKRRQLDQRGGIQSMAQSESPGTDAPRLCPYCDSVLPEGLSDTFEDLLRGAFQKSWPAPRAANPYALKASAQIYAEVCERHRFEVSILPRAIRAGWPTTIDFDRLPERITQHRQILDRILDNPSSSSFFHDMMDTVAKVGVRVAESAMGQFATFQRVQPGYYGERGAMVLHQIMLLLYPLQDLRRVIDRFAPLSEMTVRTSILLPEAALSLIMEDQGVSRADALKIMRSSSRYGNMMFPDDDDADSLIDTMMREAARRRRAEIQAEEEAEEAEALAKEEAQSAT